MASELSDADLLDAHVAGDAEAFGLLVARHRDRLWAVALRTCGDPETAADGLQEALISAFRRAGSFRGDSAVTTWLHRVVVNACLDRLRAAKVRRAEPLPDDLDRLDHFDHFDHFDGPRRTGRTTRGDAVDPAERTVADEERARVHAALAELPPAQRAAVVLVDMEGYSVAEVAEILDCAEGTVKSRCSRARARLAVLLADVLEVPDPGPAGPTDGAQVPGNPASEPLVSGMATRAPPPVATPTFD